MQRRIAGRWWQWADADEECHRYLEQHWKDAEAALGFVKNMRVCVQAGGNFGVWPWLLSQFFERVYTFEPEPECFRLLLENTKDRLNIFPSPYGLGAQNTKAEVVYKPRNHGAQHLVFGRGEIEVVTLDSFALENVDLIDLDIEGAEPFALEGARETIERCKPVIVVEEWRSSRVREGHAKSNYGHGQTGSEWLAERGYKQVARVGQDNIFVPE